jgi:leader peptidase (prepilin peptidase) / N-methyltransferase
MSLIEGLGHSPGLLLLATLVLGLCVGSFLNVVAHRLPAMMEREWKRECRSLLELPSEAEPAPLSLLRPRSRCPACQAAIWPWHNIPVLSWLALRGRCAACGAAISVQYPLVEGLTAVLSVACAWRFGWTPALAAALVPTWVLIALSVIDLRTQLLPDSLTLPLLWLGLLLSLSGVFTTPAASIAGGAAGYLILWSVYQLFRLATGKEGMGFGDFKLLAALAGAAGPDPHVLHRRRGGRPVADPVPRTRSRRADPVRPVPGHRGLGGPHGRQRPGRVVAVGGPRLTVGLTGGVASGKSLAAAAFAALGVPVCDADQEVVARGSEALARIAAEFGAEVLLPDGQLDRRRMREIVFADPGARRRLEAITHPLIRARLLAWRDAQRAPYVILDVPILVESGMDALVERILVVDASEETQVRRLVARDGIGAALARQMLAAQATRAERLAHADDVIANEGSPEDLNAAVARQHRRYLEMAQA